MTHPDSQLQADIARQLAALRALRDEARLKSHLASMDAREAWRRLEPKLVEAERVAANAPREALEALAAIVKSLSDFLGAL